MKHALIQAATKGQLEAAREAADWMLDAVACATQDRTLLRGEADYNELLGESIMANCVVACLRAMQVKIEPTP